MKGLFESIAHILSLLYPYKLQQKIVKYKILFHTTWVSKEFNSESNKKHTRILYPLYLKGGRYITHGDTFACGKRFRLECWDNYNGIIYSPKIIIMNNVNIGHDCHIGAINYIYIGNNVLIGSKVFISDHFHGNISYNELQTVPIKRNLYSKGKVIIEDNVWIGEGVSILPAVVIGKNCIVAANSIVTKSFPPNCVIAGNPAKIIKIISKESVYE